MDIERITSVQNALIKLMRSLSGKKGREQTGCFLIEGPKMLNEALSAGIMPEAVLISAEPGIFDEFIARLKNVRVAYVPSSVMDAVCDTRTPQGIAASIRIPPSAYSRDSVFVPDRGDFLRTRRIIALCGVQDPGNVGTIWRTAEAAGFDGLILSPECADPFSPKVLRATMGAAFRVPVSIMPVIPALAELSSKGFSHYAADTRDSVDVMTACPDFKTPLTLVIGSEGSGIPPSVLKECGMRLRIPMRGGTESLNAAVAAAILMYKIVEHSDACGCP